VKRLLFCLCLCLLLAACGKTARDQLLDENYKSMTDTGIVRYYYDLDDAIEACEYRSRQDSGLGVSVGGGWWSGGGGGMGLGVTRDASDHCDSTTLRQRRTDVRLEMDRRGVKP
jgi:hypothetical protein